MRNGPIESDWRVALSVQRYEPLAQGKPHPQRNERQRGSALLLRRNGLCARFWGSQTAACLLL